MWSYLKNKFMEKYNNYKLDCYIDDIMSYHYHLKDKHDHKSLFFTILNAIRDDRKDILQIIFDRGFTINDTTDRYNSLTLYEYTISAGSLECIKIVNKYYDKVVLSPTSINIIYYKIFHNLDFQEQLLMSRIIKPKSYKHLTDEEFLNYINNYFQVQQTIMFNI